MATFRNVGTIPEYKDKMIEGMVTRGYERAFAERCYNQIKGFGGYGFPESHAQSFAKLVYVVFVAEMPSPRGFRLRHPQFAADGLLRPRAACLATRVSMGSRYARST